MARVHDTAIIDTKATIADTAVVGPYCVIGPDVVLGEGVEVRTHAVIQGRTTIGAKTVVFPFSVVGGPPQDLKFKGEPSRLAVGKNVVIREHVTINPGTRAGGMLTKVGDNVLLAIGAHVAHDNHIGNNVLVMNHVLLGGHVTIGDFAVVGGGAAVRQFVRIGAHAMVGGLSGVDKDLIPYGLVEGNRARLQGLNLIGIKRRGFSQEDITTLREAYRRLFLLRGGARVLAERLNDVNSEFGNCSMVSDIVRFIEASSSQSLCLPEEGSGV